MTRPKTVLIVEDNLDNRDIYATFLEHAGYRVVQAEDGREGVERARAVVPDIVLMDVSMPVMDGYEAFAAIRADPRTSGIPVVAVTAHALDGERQRVVDAGFDGYVPKPAEPGLVLQAVRDRIGDP